MDSDTLGWTRISTEMKNVDEMSVREMREELDSLGIGYSDCIEKGDFVSKLNSARQSNRSPSGTREKT
jgi:hypothetical protein